MHRKEDSRDIRQVIWFSSVIRWILGLLFIIPGYIYRGDGGSWVLLLFGTVFILTGFIRPNRCLEDNSSIPD